MPFLGKNFLAYEDLRILICALLIDYLIVFIADRIDHVVVHARTYSQFIF